MTERGSFFKKLRGVFGGGGQEEPDQSAASHALGADFDEAVRQSIAGQHSELSEAEAAWQQAGQEVMDARAEQYQAVASLAEYFAMHADVRGYMERVEGVPLVSYEPSPDRIPGYRVEILMADDHLTVRTTKDGEVIDYHGSASFEFPGEVRRLLTTYMPEGVSGEQIRASFLENVGKAEPREYWKNLGDW